MSVATMEHKAVSVSGVKSAMDVVDESQGIVEAFVSITGIRDRVGDVIMPGAYTKSLTKRVPKGIWHHDWKTSVSKTLEVKELLPGNADLPDTLPDGTPWPSHAGALRVKMQFNLKTQRGLEAFEDIKFFGDQQEWSIGYQVPSQMATKTDGVRYIKELELYEYSPVLFGAMPSARTLSVKSAQNTLTDMKNAVGSDVYAFLGDNGTTIEHKSLVENDDSKEENVMLSPEDIAEIKSAFSVLSKHFGEILEQKSEDEDTTEGLIDVAIKSGIDDSDFLTKAASFDIALGAGDIDQIDLKALDVVSAIEELGLESKAEDVLTYVKSAVVEVLRLEDEINFDDVEFKAYDYDDEDEYDDEDIEDDIDDEMDDEDEDEVKSLGSEIDVDEIEALKAEIKSALGDY